MSYQVVRLCSACACPPAALSRVPLADDRACGAADHRHEEDQEDEQEAAQVDLEDGHNRRQAQGLHEEGEEGCGDGHNKVRADGSAREQVRNDSEIDSRFLLSTICQIIASSTSLHNTEPTPDKLHFRQQTLHTGARALHAHRRALARPAAKETTHARTTQRERNRETVVCAGRSVTRCGSWITLPVSHISSGPSEAPRAAPVADRHPPLVITPSHALLPRSTDRTRAASTPLRITPHASLQPRSYMSSTASALRTSASSTRVTSAWRHGAAGWAHGVVGLAT